MISSIQCFMKLAPIILLFFLMLASCQREQVKGSYEEIDFQETGSSNAADLFDLSFVKLETNDQCLLGGVYQCFKVDAGFLLLDNMVSKGVYLFASDGKFIQQIGKQGNGPSEYVQPFSMTIDSEQQLLSVIDAASQKMQFYSLSDFQYLYERKLPFLRFDMETLSPNSYYWYNFTTSEESDAHIFKTDSTFNIINHYQSITFSSGYTLGANRKLSKQNGEITFYTSYGPEVYRIKEDGVQCVYKFKFGEHNMAPVDYLEENAANNQNYIPKLLDSHYVAFYNFFETEQSLCVPYYWNKKMFFGFYDKKSKKTYCFSQEDIQRDLKVGALSSPVGVIDNHSYVSLLRPDLLLQLQQAGRPLDKRLADLLSQSAEDDNPILLIYSLRQDR